jgi:hypothetical protein
LGQVTSVQWWTFTRATGAFQVRKRHLFNLERAMAGATSFANDIAKGSLLLAPPSRPYIRFSVAELFFVLLAFSKTMMIFFMQ